MIQQLYFSVIHDIFQISNFSIFQVLVWHCGYFQTTIIITKTARSQQKMCTLEKLYTDMYKSYMTHAKMKNYE